MSVVGHFASCSKSDDNDQCVEIMATMDGDGRRKTSCNHERLYRNAEKKLLKKEIRKIVSQKYLNSSEE